MWLPSQDEEAGHICGAVTPPPQAGSSEELGRWQGVLLAESGSSADPESLYYDYVDLDTIANIRNAARHSFL